MLPPGSRALPGCFAPGLLFDGLLPELDGLLFGLLPYDGLLAELDGLLFGLLFGLLLDGVFFDGLFGVLPL